MFHTRIRSNSINPIEILFSNLESISLCDKSNVGKEVLQIEKIINKKGILDYYLCTFGNKTSSKGKINIYEIKDNSSLISFSFNYEKKSKGNDITINSIKENELFMALSENNFNITLNELIIEINNKEYKSMSGLFRGDVIINNSDLKDSSVNSCLSGWAMFGIFIGAFVFVIFITGCIIAVCKKCN